jgi:hypothetical protein
MEADVAEEAATEEALPVADDEALTAEDALPKAEVALALWLVAEVLLVNV